MPLTPARKSLQISTLVECTALAQIADTLHELGFRGLRATGLRRKHVVALVKEWKRQGRSIGTMNPSCSVRKILLYQYVEG